MLEAQLVHVRRIVQFVYFFLMAFSAALVTSEENIISTRSVERYDRWRLTLSSLAIRLLNGLDNTDSDGLSHITYGKATERWVLVVGLDTHWLGRHELDDSGITRLDELGARLHYLTRSAIDLLNKLGELAGNVGGVAIEDGGVASADLTGVVEHDDLGVERRRLLSGVVLGVRANVSTSDILDGHVPRQIRKLMSFCLILIDSKDLLDVEADVVTWNTLLELLVMHFDGLDFSGDVGGSELDDHASLDDACLHTTDGHRANTANLVHILEGKAEGLIGRA